MTSPSRPGRPYVFAIAIAIVLVSLATIVLSNLVTGWQNIGQQSIRFVLTVGMSIYLVRGANWARQLSILLFGLAGVAGVIAGVRFISLTPYASLLILQGVIYFACGGTLWLVPSVKAYFQAPQAIATAADAA